MQDLTTGSITQHLLKTTSFMLASMVFQTLYVLVDLYWVGRLGTEAVAAVAISGNLIFIVLAVTQMLGVGTTTLVAHAAGRRDRDRARLVFNQSQVASIVLGSVFFVVAMISREAYATSMSANAETRRLTNDYLLWFIPAMTLQFGIVAMSAALRGTGNFKPGMNVQIATVVLNIALAPFLIFGWGIGHAFGVAGAAMATFIAIVIGTVWLVTYFLPDEAYLRFVRADLWPQPRLWRDLLKIGMPAGAEFALMSVYLSIVLAVSRPFGAAAQAGFGIGLRVIQAFFMPVVALAFSAAPVAGQNFGARLGGRVRQTFTTAVLMACGIMVALAAIVQVAPMALIRPFSADPEVLQVGAEYLRIISWSFVGSGIAFVSSSMFQAIGNTIPPLVSSCTRIVMVAIPLFFMARQPGFSLRSIWYLSAATVVIQMTMNLLLLRREFRRRLAFTETAA